MERRNGGLSRAGDLVLVALAFVLPLAFWPSLASILTLKTAVLVTAVILALSLRLGGAAAEGRWYGDLSRSGARLLVLFVVASTVSWFVGPYRAMGESALLLLWGLLALFLLCASGGGEERAGRLQGAFVAAASIVAALAGAEALGIVTLQTVGSWAPRSAVTFTHPNFCGTFLAVVMPWVLAMRTFTLRRRLLRAGLACLLLAGILCTGSRGALLTVVMACGYHTRTVTNTLQGWPQP